jgi:hypothetical protein
LSGIKNIFADLGTLEKEGMVGLRRRRGGGGGWRHLAGSHQYIYCCSIKQGLRGRKGVKKAGREKERERERMREGERKREREKVPKTKTIRKLKADERQSGCRQTDSSWGLAKDSIRASNRPKDHANESLLFSRFSRQRDQ